MNKSKNQRSQHKSINKPSENTENDSKSQRTPRQGPERKNHSTTTENSSKVTKEQDHKALFANLKKETDEIHQLTKKNYLKREICSNWERYNPREELNENQDENFIPAADFTQLLQIPLACGSHFQFKSEKEWNVKLQSKYSEYFFLDLKSISNGLMCIPFYERCEIDMELLTPQQISSMNNQALTFQNKMNKTTKKLLNVTKNQNSSTNNLNSNQEKIISILINKDEEAVDLKDEKTIDLNNKETIDLNDKEIVYLNDTETIDFNDKELIDLNGTKTEDSKDKKTDLNDKEIINKVPDYEVLHNQLIESNENMLDNNLELDIDKLLSEATLSKSNEHKIATDTCDSFEFSSVRMNWPEQKVLSQLSNPIFLNTESTKVDLEQWLDDILDD